MKYLFRKWTVEEGILSILSKKIERSDSTLRHSSFDFSEFFFDQTGRFCGQRLG
jgi:hypothetical protein